MTLNVDHESTKPTKLYKLTGADRKIYLSETPGTLGGWRGGKIYGRLDCASALRNIAKGNYVKERVFFADEATAIAAGYRPCARCMPEKYAQWKATQPPKKEQGKTLMPKISRVLK